MGIQFSPMYEAASTSTIKANGDLNVSPYDVIGVDGKFDTVEADEFVGGVGNFTKINGKLYVPWTTTTTATNVQLTPSRSGTAPANTTGWRTVLTFNIPQPTTQPSFGINLDSNVSTFYSSISCNDIYTQVTYRFRVNGVEYPSHSGVYSFTEPNVLFNIGDNVVEFYQNVPTSYKPNATITMPAVYIAPITD